METLSDNIYLHQIFPFLDFFLQQDLIVFRKVSKRFHMLFRVYFKNMKPVTFNIKYLNDQNSQANALKILFENEVNEIYENINKETHGQLLDYLSQNNQNNIEKTVLDGIKILMDFVGFKRKKPAPVKSRTENKKRIIYSYLEFFADYWQFKNKLNAFNIFEVEESKLKKLSRKMALLCNEKIQPLRCLSACLAYIDILFQNMPNCEMLKFAIRSGSEGVSEEAISARLMVLSVVFKEIF